MRIEVLAKELKVSKGSFYWHFPDRQALLTAVLGAWESAGTDAIIAATDLTALPPTERVAALVKEVFSHPDHDGFEVAVRAWARADQHARVAVGRVDQRRVDYVASLARDGGVPADIALMRAQVLYRALLGEFLLRNYGTPGLDAAGLRDLTEALVRDAS